MIREWMLWLINILLILSVLLYAAAKYKSFWEDETFTVQTAEGGIEKISQLAKKDMHPPLMYLISYYWGSKFGFNELGLRSLSILFSVLTMFFVFLFSRDAFDQRTAFFSIILLALSPIYIMFAHNVRYYAFAGFLTIFTVFTMYRFSTKHKPVYLILYVASITVLLNLIYLSISVFLACNLWWFINFIANSSRKRSQLILWLIAQTVVIVLFLFRLHFLSNTVNLYTTEIVLQNFVAEFIKRVALLGYSFSVGETLTPTNPVAWLGLLVVFSISLFAIWKNRKNINFWLVVISVGSILLFNLIASFNPSLISTWQNISNRSLYALPLFLIGLSTGLTKMKNHLSLIALSILVFIYVVGLYNFFKGNQYFRPGLSVNWHEIFYKITTEAQPDSVVICNDGDITCSYYARKYGFNVYKPNHWENINMDSYSEIWWVQSNLIRESNQENIQNIVFEELSNQYAKSPTVNYAPHDPSIRKFKTTVLNMRDYDFRVNVVRFQKP